MSSEKSGNAFGSRRRSRGNGKRYHQREYREVLKEYLAAFPGIDEQPENFISSILEATIMRSPIKRGQSWKLITSICQEVGLQGNFGTHSLRKDLGLQCG